MLRRSVSRKCCSSQVSCLTRCMRKLRRSTRWLWYGLVDRARCVSRDVTLHRLSVLIRLVDNSPLDSRLHLNANHAKECLTHHPCIESVTVGCLCQCCTPKSSFTLSSYFAQETSKHSVLGRYQNCSKERIQVLSNAIERRHPLRHTPSSLYPESYHGGNWRSH